MKNTFGGSLRNSPPITMDGVLMFRSERMRRTGARSTASGTSSHMQYWADCITGTHESSFWKRQGSADVLLFRQGIIHWECYASAGQSNKGRISPAHIGFGSRSAVA